MRNEGRRTGGDLCPSLKGNLVGLAKFKPLQPILMGASCHWCLQGIFFIAKPSEYIQMIASPFHYLLCSLFPVLHAKHCKKTHPEHLRAFLPVSNPPVLGVWVTGGERAQNILKSSSWSDLRFCGGVFFLTRFLKQPQHKADLSGSSAWLNWLCRVAVFWIVCKLLHFVLFSVLKVFSPTVCAAA